MLAEQIPASSTKIAMCQGRVPDGWIASPVDICDQQGVEALVSSHKPQIVIHLAAQSSVGNAGANCEQTWRANALGTFSLASACAKHAAGAVFLFSSSAEVYGSSFNLGAVDETAPLFPLNCYAKTKAASEYILEDVLIENNKLIIARSFNHTGAGQDERFVLPSFARQIALIESGLQKPKLMTGNLESERDFLHVDDVCKAYMGLLNASDLFPTKSVFNVSSNTAYKIGDILSQLRSLSIADFEIEQDPARLRPSEIARALGKNAKLRSVTDWSPQSKMVDILAELLDNARKNVQASRQ